MMLEIGQIGDKDLFIHHDKFSHTGPEFSDQVMYQFVISPRVIRDDLF